VTLSATITSQAHGFDEAFDALLVEHYVEMHLHSRTNGASKPVKARALIENELTKVNIDDLSRTLDIFTEVKQVKAHRLPRTALETCNGCKHLDLQRKNGLQLEVRQA
jgi:hypothetical protein